MRLWHMFVGFGVVLIAAPASAELYRAEVELRLLFSDHGVAPPRDPGARRQAVIEAERVATVCFGIHGDCGCGAPEAIDHGARCEAALAVLRRLGSGANAAALDQLDDARTSWYARVWLIDALGKSGDPRLVPALVRALGRLDKRVDPEDPNVPAGAAREFAQQLGGALDQITGADRDAPESVPGDEMGREPHRIAEFWTRWAEEHGTERPERWWRAATLRAQEAVRGPSPERAVHAARHLLGVRALRATGLALVPVVLARRDVTAGDRASLRSAAKASAP
jgi:hypothetical protein